MGDENVVVKKKREILIAYDRLSYGAYGHPYAGSTPAAPIRVVRFHLVARSGD